MSTIGTTSNINTASSLTLQMMQAARRRVEPLYDYMVEQGFDPADGCFLVLPETLREKFPHGAPDYVRFSRLLTDPCLVCDTMKLMQPRHR